MLKNVFSSPAVKRLLLTLVTVLLAAFGVQGVDPSSETSVVAGAVAGLVSLLHVAIQTAVERVKAKEQPQLLATLQRLEAALLEKRQRVTDDTVEVVERVRLLVRSQSNPPPPETE